MADTAVTPLPQHDVLPSARRLTRSVTREAALVRTGVAAIALHVADDNFVQPARGTSAGDHLASGLVPVVILAALAAVYPRLRAGARAGMAMTLGGLGIAAGVPAAYYLLDGSASGDHYTGLVALAAGAAMLMTIPVTLWNARRTGGSRRRRYVRRAGTIAAAPVVGAMLVWLIVFPIGFSYGYTHTGRTAVAPDLRVPYESVTVTTSDSLELTASYVPSKNRAAVILFPGATRSDEARMLIRHGYGVLLLDPRGQGASEGDTVRWAGDRDLLAGLEYVRGRADVDRGRIGAFGFSVGGEILLEAAAQSTGFKAVVSEGAGFRIGDADDLSGADRLLLAPIMPVLTAATAVFSNHRPPPPIVDRIGRIAPRSVFLIYADPGMGGETVRHPKYYAAAGEPKAIWKVPGAEHTGGLDARPAEYERRVTAFFDGALLGGA